MTEREPSKKPGKLTSLPEIIGESDDKPGFSLEIEKFASEINGLMTSLPDVLRLMGAMHHSLGNKIRKHLDEHGNRVVDTGTRVQWKLGLAEYA